MRVSLAVVGAQDTRAGIDTLVSVENLIGSEATDIMTGDATVNRLVGNRGNDRLYGGDGDDWIDGGTHNDLLDGGAGVDTASYASATAGVTVNLGTTAAQDTGGAGIDTLISMNNVTGSAFADALRGTSGTNVLIGGDGDDWIDGGAGNDRMDGGAGVDTASYASATAAVTVSLAVAAAQNTGGAGVDTLTSFHNLTGSAFADVLTGAGGANLLVGGDGDDWIDGGAGDDRLDGGAGVDTASYASATAAVTVNLGTTAAQNTGGAGTDTLISMNNVTGSAFNDVLTGTNGTNVIVGGAGNDRLDGRAGNDTLTGGAGNDTFLFQAGFGRDRITDFVAGGTEDRLDFSAFAGKGVTVSLTQVGADAVFTFSSGEVVTLTGVNSAGLVHSSEWIWS